MSSFASGIVGVIVGFLVAQGFKDVSATKDSKGNTVFTGTDQTGKSGTIATLAPQMTEASPYVNVFEFAVRIETALNNTDPNNPDVKISNPFNNQDCILLGIEAIFDSAFSAHGGFRARINTTDLVTDTTSTPADPKAIWKDAGGWDLDCRPNGQKFRKNDFLNIWATNDDAMTTVAITLTITFAIVDSGE